MMWSCVLAKAPRGAATGPVTRLVACDAWPARRGEGSEADATKRSGEATSRDEVPITSMHGPGLTKGLIDVRRRLREFLAAQANRTYHARNYTVMSNNKSRRAM